MAAYNGHPSRNAWSVAMWINNEEHLYREALRIVARYGTGELAARRFCTEVVGHGAKTPDGYRYSVNSVRHALKGLAD